ncbi:MAG: DsbE family thiol:disulfide interchange protein [Phenylobacterium sp.]|uniref:DsbE family thiol:disulfide interchange protein n=1 Tax=Phenylobacterium sp. TaxID=1871053 RepID=UPI002735A192|nr:DsbE family thiol:disulfide interchange protein [Phenylobacterium sp.]MDP3173008.1 DsbE family thiol:disulfide interchange protein [Phenylobacterium sp.]
MKRWLAALPLIALAALGALFALYALNRNPHVEPQALVGKPVPALTLPDLDDGVARPLRAALGDGPALVNFYASWCAPCEVEQPTLIALKSGGVRIVGVAYKDAPQNAQAFLDRLGDPFSVRLVDRDGRGGIEFGVTGVPETFAVRDDGVIAAKHSGPMSLSQAQALLAKAR